MGKDGGSDREASQQFTTSPNSGGYRLDNITVHTAAKTGTPANFAETLNANGNTPGSALVTLSGSNPDTAGSHTYTCSGAGCNLAAGTTYFIVIKADGSTGTDNHYTINTTQSDNDTLAPTGNGWSIANGSFSRSGGSWTPISTSAYRIAVGAAPEPSLDAGNATTTTATLTLSNYPGGWWLKQTAPLDRELRGRRGGL